MVARALVFVALLAVAGGASARDCGYWYTFAYEMQYERQKGGQSRYDAFKPKDAFEWAIRNAVYQYPKYFKDKPRRNAAKRFARDVKYDCEVRYR